MALTLRTKLIVPLLLIGTLFAVVGAWILNWGVQDHMRNQSVERSRLLAVAINETAEALGELQEVRFAVEDIVASNEGISDITLATRNPFVIWASSAHPGAFEDHASRKMLHVLMDALEQGTFGHYLLPGGDILTLYPLLTTGYNSQDYRDRFLRGDPGPGSLFDTGEVLSQVILEPDEYRGVIYLRMDSSAIRAGAADIFLRSGFTLLSAVLALILLIYVVLHRSVLKPIRVISDIVQRQKAGLSETRVPTLDKDEIGELGESFNRMLTALSERDQRLRTVVDKMPVAVGLRNTNGHYSLTNNKFSLWLGALIGPPDQLKSEAFKARLSVEKQVRERGSDITYEETIQQDDGGYRHFMTTVFPVTDPSGNLNALGSVSTDITERKASEQEIRTLAFFDSLTRLPNRSLFTDRLQKAIQSAQRNHTVVGLLYMDLDGFKSVNDTLGHRFGDMLLQEIGRRLNASVRGQDTVARMGGDEFTVIVVDLTPAKAREYLAGIATKMRHAISQPIRLGEHQTFVTSSIGIALYPDDAESIDDLTVQADIAMYHAKGNGRDAYQFFQPEMNTAMHERRQIEDQLRQALMKNELSVAYQPKIDTLTGELIGAEALLRWRNPILGQVPTLKFIEIAEDSGLIVPIGEWVLQTVVENLCRWQSHGIDIPKIAVNLSPRQLRDKQFTPKVQALLKKSGLSPEQLEFEITEGVFLQEVEHSHSALYQLRESGVGLAIDDFGTGFSSLSYLKRLPVSSVKIDKSFVDGVAVDPVDEDIVMAIIAMAHSMHLTVVAEGVESQDQYDFLRDVHCDAVQGWMTGVPMYEDEFIGWLADNQRVVSDVEL